MPSRQYDVDAEPLPDGFWPGQAIDAGPARSDLEALLLDAAAVLERIGGAFSIVSLRQELVDVNNNPTGLFATVGYRAKWESFAPAQRAPEPRQEAQPEPPQPAPPQEPEPEPEPQPQVAEPQEDFLADDEEDDFGPDAEDALRERAVAAAAE